MAKGNQIITSLLFNIESNTAELKRGIDQATSTIDAFGKNVSRIGGLIGVAFGAREIGQFVLECSKLAGEFEGVNNAFSKISGHVQLLQDLKKATNGTVSELNLMKRAVQFENFGLSLEQLPKLLEFATKRAEQTGQSVDYLVDSIVTGLGRKSVLILDNLGISSSQLNAEIAKTGDFMGAVGTIVDRELAKMGSSVENTLTKTQRLSASWDNFKVTIGQAANETGFLGSAVDGLSASLDLLASRNLNFWDKLIALFGQAGGIAYAVGKEFAISAKKAAEEQKNQLQVMKEVDRYFKEFNGNIEAYSKAISTHVLKTQLLEEFQKRLNAQVEKKAKSIENIANLEERLAELQEKMRLQTGKALEQTKQEILALQAKLDLLKEMEKHSSQNAGDSIKLTKDQQKSYLKMPQVQIDGSIPVLKEQEQVIIRLQTQWEKLGDTIVETFAQRAPAAFDALGQALGRMLATQQAGWKVFVSIVLDLIRDVINAMLVKATAGLIAKEVETKGWLGLVTAAIGVGALTAFWNSKVDKFANGGTAPGGIAMVGERGAELVHLPGGSRVYNHSDTKRMLGNGKLENIRLEAIITGEQLKLVSSRTDRRRNNSI